MISSSRTKQRPWLGRTVVGIVTATFFSDFSHEMCTAVLPLFLSTIGLGPAALGAIEGLADLLMSLSKLGGGVLGHHVRRKRPWTSLGYLMTALATSFMGLVQALPALLSLRAIAWIGRGFRSPLRDYLLADAVEETHYGRAYGLERAGDMLGAVAGPLVATALVWAGIEFRSIILWSIVPGLVAAASILFLAKDRPAAPAQQTVRESTARPKFPKIFWLFLGGVFLFGMGDFSRTFLIWLAARGLGEDAPQTAGIISGAVLLYAFHNATSAVAAYPIGHLGDRRSKLKVLNAGYALGVGTNLLLAFYSGSLAVLSIAILFSGIYIAVEETLEKAVAAEFLPRELRSLGFGILASINAVGDMVSSLYVGFFLQSGRPGLGFGIAAAMGCAGAVWIAFVIRKNGNLGPLQRNNK